MDSHLVATSMVQENAVIQRIYADYAATTPLGHEVAKAMQPWLSLEFGNPSSLYEEGRRAKDAIDEAREQLSSTLGCLFAEVLFTGSGTEAANLAIIGSALAADGSRNRILLGSTEHHCVLHTLPILDRLGYRVDLIPVNRVAGVELEALEEMLNDEVLLVSVMHANNELGTIQPAKEVAKLAHQKGALYHCDAVQTFTSLSWKIEDVNADLLTLSAHKIGGPKGVGAIYTKAGVKLQPLIVGGSQEREMRAGTENVAGIVGFAAAVRAAQAGGQKSYPAAVQFREALREAGASFSNSSWASVLPGHVHVRFPGVAAESLLIRLDRGGVSASAGSACSSGSLEPSHVMLACGYSESQAKEGVRFSFGPNQPAEEGRECAERVLEAVQAIRRA